MPATPPAQVRYSAVAMALHWLIALAVLLLLGSGMTMTRMAPGLLSFDLYQWHKALGITVLALTLLRIIWRLTHRPPPLPDSMPRLERLAAHLGHAGLYALLLVLPLTGWAMVSASPLNIPTTWFNLFLIPHLPTPETLEARKALESGLEELHGIGGWLMLALVGVHVAAALRHALILRDGIFSRMVPARAPTLRQLAWAILPVLAIAAAFAFRGPALEQADRTAALTDAAPASAADSWIIDPARSRLGFRGTQMGAPFEGEFRRFTAEIVFDPDRPDSGHVLAVVDTGSAHTGDSQKDTALPQADWFDVGAFPEARFEAGSFRRTGPDSYEAIGSLTIRGMQRPVALPFTLADEGDATRATGRVQLIRTEFGVGQGQFATGDWVALEVDVTVDLVARRAR